MLMNLPFLTSIGLSQGEAKVYGALLEIGVCSLQSIHEKTAIDRRNIYDIINKLVEKGLVSYTVEKGRKKFQITHPNKLLDFIDCQKDVIKEREGEVRQHLPNLISLFSQKKESYSR